MGTRFQSVVLSLMSGTRAVAIEYEHKTRGIMRDLGLEAWVPPITCPDSGLLVDRVRELVKDSERIMAQVRPRIGQLHEDGLRSLGTGLGLGWGRATHVAPCAVNSVKVDGVTS